MAPSSQELEPPGNPVRFTGRSSRGACRRQEGIVSDALPSATQASHAMSRSVTVDDPPPVERVTTKVETVTVVASQNVTEPAFVAQGQGNGRLAAGGPEGPTAAVPLMLG